MTREVPVIGRFLKTNEKRRRRADTLRRMADALWDAGFRELSWVAHDLAREEEKKRETV